MPQNNPLPGWYQDPSGFGEGRYWDGVVWTNSVTRSGATIEAPIEPERAALPPVPGSELRTPAPVVASSYVAVPATKQSPVGAIVGVIGAILIVVLIIVLITSGDDSSNDDTPPANTPPATEAPTTEAPAAPDTTG